MEKIGLYVDVQNVYYTTRDAFGRPFDYRSLWRRLAAAGELSPAIAYATDRGDDAQRRFQDALRHLGFTVRLKPFIQRADIQDWRCLQPFGIEQGCDAFKR